MDNTESPPLTPKRISLEEKKSKKHKPQISLIETENSFKLIETESQKSLSKQRNPKYSKSLTIRSKSLETIEITECSQIKRNPKTKTKPKRNNQTHKD